LGSDPTPSPRAAGFSPRTITRGPW
jgi:hypothetical protein